MKRTAPIRRNRYGSRFPKRRQPEFMRWMKECAAFLPIKCELQSSDCRYWPYSGAVTAHLIPRSRGGEDKGNTVFLCTKHHSLQEKRTDAFNAEHKINLYARAKRWAERYDDGFEFLESA